MSAFLNALVRLRPPYRPSPKHFRCWAAGIRDGIAQPHELSSSTSVESLLDGDYHWKFQESLDRGICLGQFLGSPTRCEQYWAKS